MTGMPGWLAASQNTWPDDNMVTAECLRKKEKKRKNPTGRLAGQTTKDISITGIRQTV